MTTRFEKILFACGEEMGKLAFASGVQAPAFRLDIRKPNAELIDSK